MHSEQKQKYVQLLVQTTKCIMHFELEKKMHFIKQSTRDIECF
jgi:hypothetical protein